MRTKDFIIVDVETTGLSPVHGDRICEFGAVHIRGGKEIATFTTLVNPGRPISRGATEVNGITTAMVRKAPSFRDIASEVAQWLEGRIFVAHNAQFDLSFLASEFQRLGKPLPVTDTIDTLALTRKYYNFPSNSLSAIAEQLHIGTPESIGL